MRDASEWLPAPLASLQFFNGANELTGDGETRCLQILPLPLYLEYAWLPPGIQAIFNYPSRNYAAPARRTRDSSVEGIDFARSVSKKSRASRPEFPSARSRRRVPQFICPGNGYYSGETPNSRNLRGERQRDSGILRISLAGGSRKTCGAIMRVCARRDARKSPTLSFSPLFLSLVDAFGPFLDMEVESSLQCRVSKDNTSSSGFSHKSISTKSTNSLSSSTNLATGCKPCSLRSTKVCGYYTARLEKKERL